MAITRTDAWIWPANQTVYTRTFSPQANDRRILAFWGYWEGSQSHNWTYELSGPGAAGSSVVEVAEWIELGGVHWVVADIRRDTDTAFGGDVTLTATISTAPSYEPAGHAHFHDTREALIDFDFAEQGGTAAPVATAADQVVGVFAGAWAATTVDVAGQTELTANGTPGGLFGASGYRDTTVVGANTVTQNTSTGLWVTFGYVAPPGAPPVPPEEPEPEPILDTILTAFTVEAEAEAPITPANVEQPSEITIPSVLVHIPITPNEVEQPSEITIPTVIRDTDIAVANVEQGSEITQPSVTRIVSITPNAVEQPSEITQPVVVRLIQPNDVASSSEITQPTVRLRVVSNDVEQPSEITQPTARVNVTPEFVGPNISNRNSTTGVLIPGLNPAPRFTLDPVKAQTWSLPAGPLPPGLVIDQNTGIVSGTPTLAGVYPGIVIQVSQPTGGGGAAETAQSNAFSWTVTDPTPLTGEGQNPPIAIMLGLSL